MTTLCCNIYKFYHARHKNVAGTCSKIESTLFCCTLQQNLFMIICYTARKKHLWATVQFFHAHAMQQIALHAHQKIAPSSLTFRNFAKFTGKQLCQSLFFNNVAGWGLTLLNKELWHWCFPVNFAKSLRTPFLTEHLWWLLLFVLFFCSGRILLIILYENDSLISMFST